MIMFLYALIAASLIMAFLGWSICRMGRDEPGENIPPPPKDFKIDRRPNDWWKT